MKEILVIIFFEEKIVDENSVILYNRLDPSYVRLFVIIKKF